MNIEAPIRDQGDAVGPDRPTAPSADVSRALRTIWHSRLLLAGTTVFAGLCAWIVTSNATPVFTATTKVMVDGRVSSLADIQQYMISRVPAYLAVASEVEVIGSRTLAERVANSMNLFEDPEFNPSLLDPAREPGVLDGLSGLFAGAWKAIVGADAPIEEPAGLREDRLRRTVVDGVVARTTATAVERSVVIEVSFQSTDPAKASAIANSIAEHYVTAQLEAKFDAIRRTTSWLTDRLEDLRQAVNNSENAVAEYRREQGLIDTDGRLVTVQKLAELNSQLVVAQARRAEQQALVTRLEQLRQSGRSLEAVGEVLESSLIQSLKEQEATLAREASDLSVRYGDRHPTMAKVRAEQSEIRSKIDTEIGRLGQGLRNELAVLRDREAALAHQIVDLESVILEQNDAEIRLRELERDAQANRALYEAFLSRFKESGSQEDIQQADARIISEAQPPRSPTHPKPMLMTVAASMVGLLAGVVIALLLEIFNKTVRTREQLEQLTGLPVLGQLPQVRTLPGRGLDSYLASKPHSAFAEACRISWFALKNQDLRGDPRIVLVTSAIPEEGKTSTSLSLARTAAALGSKVLLIDADLRRPSIAKTLRISPTMGLREVLEDRSLLDQVVTQDPNSVVDILPTVPSAEKIGIDVMEAESLADLLSDLKKTYDLLILDSPPALLVADAQILGRLTDRTVFCVRWDQTPRESVTAALKMLSDAHVRVSGTLLTRIVSARDGRYGYADVGYYMGRYRGYYTR